jgi:hypothetical protein
MNKTLHITNHVGTTKNLENVFKYLQEGYNLNINLTTEKCNFPLYISKPHADHIWYQEYKQRLLAEDYTTLVFTDTCMYARPFLQNIDDHALKIIIYITNRFDWGIWGFKDEEFLNLYAKSSLHNRVIFIADNRYDQAYASAHNIKFYYDDIVRLTPEIAEIAENKIKPKTDKMFVYNRGSKVADYVPLIKNVSLAKAESEVELDIFGENYKRYRDQTHICEYIGYIHLPYQTNIQSLWENLGHGIVYFIPSQKFFNELLFTTEWYYWEEKTRPYDLLKASISLAEWYQAENADYFVYFNSWADLQEKINFYRENTEELIAKKKLILTKIKNSNTQHLAKWRNIFTAFLGY